MGLRHYHPEGYYEDYGDAIHAALEDLWTLRYTAQKLDDEGLDRLEHSGWSWTSQYSMESDPFTVIEHQLTSVLYATGYDLQADIYYAQYEELEEAEDPLEGARDDQNRRSENDPVLVCDGWHEGLLIAAARGDRREVGRLAFDLARLKKERERIQRAIRADTIKNGTPPPICRPFPRIYTRPPRTPQEMARRNRPYRDDMANKAFIFVILPTEMCFYNDEAITEIYEGLLHNWEAKRDRYHEREKEARRNRERARVRTSQRPRKRRHTQRRARRAAHGRKRLTRPAGFHRALHPTVRAALRPDNR